MATVKYSNSLQRWTVAESHLFPYRVMIIMAGKGYLELNTNSKPSKLGTQNTLLLFEMREGKSMQKNLHSIQLVNNPVSLAREEST
jgi:hypothetical protein